MLQIFTTYPTKSSSNSNNTVFFNCFITAEKGVTTFLSAHADINWHVATKAIVR